MEKTYNPKYLEERWTKEWEASGYFAPSGKGKPYCIVIPPPNVTGSLHMGHGLQNTMMDVLTRYHRMRGFNTLWQVGTDHAGIATQMVVTQRLIAAGKNPPTMTREELLQAAWEWKEKSATTIQNQMRRLGISVDWTRERFTLDSGLSAAVRKVFIELYDEGLIYRGKKLINWDPVLKTAISDLEVVSEERDGFLWYIHYPIEDSKDFIVVATTRPETILGDTAVAVHPNDDRYKHLIGRYINLPLTERRIPIIADEYVDPDFGSGCVKITPAHDFNDYLVGLRHDLPMINIFTEEAHLNDSVPEVYRGLERFAARKKIVEDLGAAAAIVKKEPYKIKIPVSQRSDAIVEPYLTDQWFVNAKALAQPAAEVVKTGKIKFVPENWSKTYLQWLENIEDWCISRQLWWGHRIPAWYDDQKNIYVGNDEAAVRAKYNLATTLTLHQDNDVLDTWFSSALWPFSTLGWPEQTQELKTFYPTSVLVTGFDIIFFWVARMVMLGMKFMGEVPFNEVYIHGLIRDKDGQKMSKSKGNILDPIDLADGISLENLLTKRTSNLMQSKLTEKISRATRQEFPQGIEPHGIDALRFTFCAIAATGRDINFDINRLAGYRNFCNKIWNATRFVLQRFAASQPSDITTDLTVADQWILTRLQLTLKEIHSFYKDYRFDLLAQTLYEFIWREYCDWYLELCKTEPKVSKTLINVLEVLLRLVHPLMPFISEELWQTVGPMAGKEGKTIMLQPYPEFNAEEIDEAALLEIEWLKKVVLAIRNIRGEMNIAPKKELTLLLRKGTEQDHKFAKNNHHRLVVLAKVAHINWLQEEEKIPTAATALVDQLELYVPLSDVIDMAAEGQRLQKEITKLHKDLEHLRTKLANESYLAKAPKNIVDQERTRFAETEMALHKLQKQLKTTS
jgi:valyl-tRNA synthetase